MGDVVMTTPLFRELKRNFPHSRLTVEVQAAYRALLATNPHIDEILSPPELLPAWIPRRIRALLSALALYRRSLRGRRFDVAISPRWEHDEHLATLLCLLANAQHRVGYSERTSRLKQRLNRGFEKAFDIRLSAGPVQHEVWRNLEIVRALGGTVEDCRPEIHLSARDHVLAAGLLAEVPLSATLVALGIGANSAHRIWPLTGYAEIVRKLALRHQVQPVILCSPEERERAQWLSRAIGSNSVVLCGEPLRIVCAVLERCHLFLGNDSGCAHLAAAMHCPTLVISPHPHNGDPNHPNSPLRFAPYSRVAQVLQPDAGRDSCTSGCKRREAHCILSISADEVLAAALAMLQRGVRPLPLQLQHPKQQLKRDTPLPPLLVPHPTAVTSAVRQNP